MNDVFENCRYIECLNDIVSNLKDIFFGPNYEKKV